MSLAKQIKAAVQKLDPANDNHWTTRGQPHLTAIAKAVGGRVTRGEVTAAVGNLSRKSAKAADDRPRQAKRRREVADASAIERSAQGVLDATNNPRGMTGPQKDLRLAAEAVLREARHA